MEKKFVVILSVNPDGLTKKTSQSGITYTSANGYMYFTKTRSEAEQFIRDCIAGSSSMKFGYYIAEIDTKMSVAAPPIIVEEVK